MNFGRTPALTEFILTCLYHLAIFCLLASLVAELALVRSTLIATQLARLARIDMFDWCSIQFRQPLHSLSGDLVSGTVNPGFGGRDLACAASAVGTGWAAFPDSACIS
jgi:hypothetical protein